VPLKSRFGKRSPRNSCETHADDYDFLVTFTGFPYDLGSDSDGGQVGGRYYGLKNDTQGIGQRSSTRPPDFGSNGRLQRLHRHGGRCRGSSPIRPIRNSKTRSRRSRTSSCTVGPRTSASKPLTDR